MQTDQSGRVLLDGDEVAEVVLGAIEAFEIVGDFETGLERGETAELVREIRGGIATGAENLYALHNARRDHGLPPWSDLSKLHRKAYHLFYAVALALTETIPARG